MSHTELKQVYLRAIDCTALGFEIVHVSHDKYFDEAKKNAQIIAAALSAKSAVQEPVYAGKEDQS